MWYLFTPILLFFGIFVSGRHRFSNALFIEMFISSVVQFNEIYPCVSCCSSVSARAQLFENTSSSQPHPVKRCSKNTTLQLYLNVPTCTSSNLPLRCSFPLPPQRRQSHVLLWGRAQPRTQLPPGGALHKRWAATRQSKHWSAFHLTITSLQKYSKQHTRLTHTHTHTPTRRCVLAAPRKHLDRPRCVSIIPLLVWRHLLHCQKPKQPLCILLPVGFFREEMAWPSTSAERSL